MFICAGGQPHAKRFALLFSQQSRVRFSCFSLSLSFFYYYYLYLCCALLFILFYFWESNIRKYFLWDEYIFVYKQADVVMLRHPLFCASKRNLGRFLAFCPSPNVPIFLTSQPFLFLYYYYSFFSFLKRSSLKKKKKSDVKTRIKGIVRPVCKCLNGVLDVVACVTPSGAMSHSVTVRTCVFDCC